jgi:hypothetical protein
VKIIAGILVAVVIMALVGCAAPPAPVPDKLGIVEIQSRQTEPLSYEVVKTYTVEVIVGTKTSSNFGPVINPRPRACVEIRNTGNIAGLFSINFSFSEEYSGRDLIYLKPGETGVATYTLFQIWDKGMSGWSGFREWREQDYQDIMAEWQYEITPVALKP